MSYATRRRRHDLTLGDKREIVRLIDNRTSQTDVAKIYNCSQSQISRIVSKRDDILTDWENCDDPAQKRCRIRTGGNAENVKRGESGQTVVDQSTSPRPPDTSLDASQQTTNSANNGWLEYWKNHSSQFGRRSYGDGDQDYTPWSRRYGSGVRRAGRGRPKASANKESRISNQLLDILKNYDLCDVYCADELALHYDVMPNLDGTGADDGDEGDGEKRGSERAGGDRSRKQITVLLTCNVTGSDRRDFLIIEDSKKSDAEPTAIDIPGCHRAKAPHAWMTSDVFKEYLLAFDYDLRRQRRYVLLLVDNAPPHVHEAGKNLEHIRILYVRSYATPFFHGIFYSVRSHYRKQILLRLYAKNQEGNTALGASSGRSSKKSRREKSSTDVSLSLDFEDAVTMLKQAWQSITPQDIVQCFSKAGICAPHIHGLPESNDDNLPELPAGFVTDEQYEEFVNVDVDAECTGDADVVSTDCRILADLRNQGFMDVGLEPSDELPPDFVGFGDSGMAKTSGDKFSGTASSYSHSHFQSQSMDMNDSTEVHGALLSVRNFLTQRGLHLHNLHALEAQIFSCDSGGPK